MAVSPGDVIDDRYVIERLLGQGGMGAVFIAREERLGRRVAIKVLLDEVVQNPEAVVRFEREARSAAALYSDHVTRVLSVGHLASGAPYIVMELLEGEDLAAVLARRGPLPGHEVVAFISPICEALSEAHALGIVHRDLKPSNVFVARRPGGGTRVKVLDFGISKSATGTVSRAITSTSALMGTPMYMSPEQLREAKNVDGRADIWALGVMMYELVNGKPPFVAEGLTALCLLIMTTPHVPLIQVRPDVAPALDAIVNRCLQKAPADRFATAHELMAALATVPRPGTVLAVPHPMPQEAPPRYSPHAETAPVRARGPADHADAAVAPPPPASAAPYTPPYAPPYAPLPPTVDPISSTQPGLPPKRPHALGLALVFASALAIGGAAFYVLVLTPSASQEDADAQATAASASASANASANANANANANADASVSVTSAVQVPDAATAVIVSSPALSASAPPRRAMPPRAAPPQPPPPPPPTSAPSAKPSATPPSNTGTLMPAVRN